MNLTDDENFDTYKIMIAGLVTACLVNLSFADYIYGMGWSWAKGFPLGWLWTSLSYMAVFFHELGHAIAFWFYGYVTLPSFDLGHGGGMTYTLTGQLLALHGVLYLGLVYLYFQLEGHTGWRRAIIALGVFHLATAHTVFHEVLCTFGGHLAEILIAAFLLFRAWLNMAPRGVFERFLNAFFGLGLAIQILVGNWALLHDDVYREFYYQQKGKHGFGDLDRVADLLNVGFSSVVIFFIGLTILVSMIIPVLFYLNRHIFFTRHTNV